MSLLTYEEFIKNRGARRTWERALDGFDEFFDNLPNNESSIDDLILFLQLMQEHHRDKNIRIKQNNDWEANDTYFMYVEQESDAVYYKRMQHSYKTYVSRNEAKHLAATDKITNKINALEAEIAKLKSSIATRE